nr:unnamed protein product [Callosobruchus chinensis]
MALTAANFSLMTTDWLLPQWRNVLFSDESRFGLVSDDYRERVWRERGQNRLASAIGFSQQTPMPMLTMPGSLLDIAPVELHSKNGIIQHIPDEGPVFARFSVANGTEPSLGCDGSDCNSKCRSIGWARGFCFLAGNDGERRVVSLYQWARAHQDWLLPQWRNVLFSDESRFGLVSDDYRERVWRERGGQNRLATAIGVAPYRGGTQMF